jgi:1-acyl-sn-glycerol-3-phosphate acyltransferase
MYISSYCICERALSEESGVYTLLPCAHIIHITCYKKLTNKNDCPLCKKKVEKKVSVEECKKLIGKNRKYKQYYYNMLSISNKHFERSINYSLVFLRSSDFIREYYMLMNNISSKETKLVIRRILGIMNCKVNFDKNKYNKIKKKNKKMVIIANHNSAIDGLVIASLFNCGGLAASFLKDTLVAKVMEPYGVVWVDRGKKSNTVKKIKEYLKKNNKLIIFPEGTVIHKDTLGEFRSGAFNIGVPILPVVIKYDKYFYAENNMTTTALRLISQQEINIDVHLLDVEYPPFNKKKVNKIRNKMSKIGNFFLTNITSKGAKK